MHNISKIKFIVLITFFVFACNFLFAQSTATVTGTVTEEKNKPVELVNVAIIGLPGGTVTDSKGKYRFTVPADTLIEISFNRNTTHNTVTQKIKLKAGEVKTLNIQLISKTQNLPVAKVEVDQRNSVFMQPLPVLDFNKMPSPNMNFESMLKATMAVVSNNELSSSYSVRGGSFDENLIYVNDIEIYRPQLVRSANQEGLTFVNPDLVENVYFSAGGFDAKYGDKMSSVLDVKYRRPEKFKGSLDLSLLGGSFHVEGASKNNRASYMLGVRQKQSQYILGSLEVNGDYFPSATDVQLLITDSIGKKTDISFLGNYNRNKYKVIPSDRETDFGTINEAYRLTVYFDGQEIDMYNTLTGALSVSHKINDKIKIRFSGSAYSSDETETFDILSQYFIGELENDLGSDEFGNSNFNRGIGSELAHARNALTANVWNVEHRGFYLDSAGTNNLSWGLKVQHELINDNLWEWVYLDSAGFSVPNPFDSLIELNDVVITKNNLETYRYSAFVQNISRFGTKDKWMLNYGIRATYNTMNTETDISPRIAATYLPQWKKRLSFKAATGIYYQPPFYREMRNNAGYVNKDLKSQRAIHFILGSEYQFLAWGREFKFVTEAYYKKLTNLVPYSIDNVRLKYSGQNLSDGYAAGIDFRLNGELVSGAESWVNLGILKTQEDVRNDYYYDYYNSKQELILPGYTFDDVAVDSVIHYPGYIPRPTDQRVTVTMFFQDYVPKLPRCKMNMTLIFGTGLPFGPPGENYYKNVFRYPPYRRVDIGFSYLFVDYDDEKKSRMKLFGKLDYLSLSLEVLNLLQVKNTVSYTWVTDVTGRQYAVPNYLTARQLNLKLSVRF